MATAVALEAREAREAMIPKLDREAMITNLVHMLKHTCTETKLRRKVRRIEHALYNAAESHEQYFDPRFIACHILPRPRTKRARHNETQTVEFPVPLLREIYLSYGGSCSDGPVPPACMTAFIEQHLKRKQDEKAHDCRKCSV